MGPTWPNRFYLHAATVGRAATTTCRSGFGAPPTIWERMAERCSGHPQLLRRARCPGTRSRSPPRPSPATTPSRPRRIDHFFRDAARGQPAATSRSSIPTSRPTTATRPTTSRCARRSRQRLPRAGREPAVVALAAGDHLRRARRLLRSRGAAPDRRSAPRVPAARLPRAGDRRRARRCGGARWCRRRSSTSRSRRPWARASGSRAWARAWTPRAISRRASIPRGSPRRRRRRGRCPLIQVTASQVNAALAPPTTPARAGRRHRRSPPCPPGWWTPVHGKSACAAGCDTRRSWTW